MRRLQGELDLAEGRWGTMLERMKGFRQQGAKVTGSG